MITKIKIVRAHAKALYWKSRMEACERYMKKHKETLATLGSGKHETEYGFFTVSENNVYPVEKICKGLSALQINACMEPRFSNERARVLFPKAYRAAKVERGYKVAL